MDDSSTWYLAEGGRTLGPFTKAQVLEQLQGGKATKSTMAFRHGTTPQWTPLGQIAEFGSPQPPPQAERPPEPPRPAMPPAPIRERGAVLTMSGAPGPVIAPFQQEAPPAAVASISPGKGPDASPERVEHQICGGEVQHLEVDLEPGASVFADANALICCDADVRIGDGDDAGGVPLALLTHQGASGRRRVTLGGLAAGAVVVVELKGAAEALWSRLDGLLCYERGISAPGGLKTVPGAAPGEGLVLHKLEGTGLCFLQASGRAIRRRLGPGERLRVDPACLVACEARVEIDVEPAGGDGPRLAVLKGPGVVWLQSQSSARLASRIRGSMRPQGAGDSR